MSRKLKAPRPARIDRLARLLAIRYEKLNLNAESVARRKAAGTFRGKKPLRRKEGRTRRPKPLIAYDLETTRIAEGTPKPLYITWHGEDTQGSLAVTSLDHLGEIVTTRLLTPEFNGARFVAWNGNNFDVYLIAASLLQHREFTLRPYLTRSKNLRGLRVVKVGAGPDGKDLSWEFLDGIAMTGLAGTNLKKFLATFAPDYGKLQGPDFEREEFDAGNVDHVRYAERDSEGLYHGMVKAQSIVMENFGIPLYPTIGNTGIRIFTRHVPQQTMVWEPPAPALKVIRDFVMRGGYCWSVRKYRGPVWKYDINQAYAAAMRDAWLPAGRCFHLNAVHPYVNAAIYRVKGAIPRNRAGARVPFYYADSEGDRVFGRGEIGDTWITNEEFSQLKREGWDLTVIEGWAWDEVFNMKEYVDKLETLRGNAAGGPSGAQGLMVKAIGNNSYGKTVERLDGLELVLSADCPEGFFAYQDDDDLFRHVWAKFGTPHPREYHQPQLGSFITAHVRMVVRRAAVLNPDAWLYTDTDCCMYSEPMNELNIDPKRYGFWKVEDEGADYIIVNKKVYAKLGHTRHAKGLNVKRLTDDDFLKWFAGEPPTQSQLQKQNFIKVMTGFDMFATRVKVGEISHRGITGQ